MELFKRLQLFPFKIHSADPSSGKRVKWEKWFHRLVKFGTIINALPFQYDCRSDQYLKLQSKRRLILWYFIFLLHTLDVLCIMVNSKRIFIEDVGYQEYIDFYVHLCSRLSAVCIGWTFALNAESCIDEMNFIIKNFRIWKERHSHFGDDFAGPIEKSAGKFMRFGVIYFLLEPFMGVTVFLECKYSMRYWLCQTILGPLFDTTFGLIVGCIMDFYFSAILTLFAGGGCSMFVAMYGPIIQFWMVTLEERFHLWPRDWQRAFMTYRSIQIAIKSLNATICPYLLPSVVYVGFWVVVPCLCAIITRFTTFPPQTLFDFILCTLLCLSLLRQILKANGKTFESGESFIEKVKKSLGCLRNGFQFGLVQRQIVSCAPLRMYAGSQFYMKRSTFLFYMRMVLERTIDAILTVMDISNE